MLETQMRRRFRGGLSRQEEFWHLKGVKASLWPGPLSREGDFPPWILRRGDANEEVLFLLGVPRTRVGGRQGVISTLNNHTVSTSK
jgi:hypothetical protein